MAKRSKTIDSPAAVKAAYAKTLAAGLPFKASHFEFDDKFKPMQNTDNPMAAHTTIELLRLAEAGMVEIEGKVLAYNAKEKSVGLKKINTKTFVESFKKNGNRKFKEAFDTFAVGSDPLGAAVGDDFVPVLGGPFYKQLYLYDYLRMNQLAFHAYNHDPMAHFIVHCTRDFVLGRGFRVDSKDPDALAIWRAFEKVNDFAAMMDSACLEIGLYGEIMLWWLPDNATKIIQNPVAGQKIPKGLIPRVRLIDPSVIWEIVTEPTDITKVLFYQWSSPTQYQIYTGKDDGVQIPSAKFIFQQIPGDQIMHHKVNCVSNEKRGRSDLFPILGYLKRLRDSVEYAVIGMQKNSAWSIDTTIEGDASDIDQYFSDQQSLGTIPPAGSEFIHTAKVKREYLGNGGGGGKAGAEAFEWCMNMIAAGVSIPVNYFGTHISGGGTRASALVATEPVAKKFEMRQAMMEKVIQKIWDRVMDWAGMDGAECEITFPEVIVQDRSAKLKDLALAEEMEWVTKERAAIIAAKELSISDFNYKEEQEEISAQGPLPLAPPLAGIAPLTAKPAAPGAGGNPEDTSKPSAVTSKDKKGISDNYGF